MLFLIVVVHAWHPRPRSSDSLLDWSYAQSHVKPLVVVPGLGCGGRLQITVSNLAVLRRSKVPFECLVGTFVEEAAFPNRTLRALASQCYIEFKVGAGFADFMQAVSAKLVHAARITHVLVVLEDVKLQDFDLGKALAISAKHNLTVSTPRIANANLHPLLSVSRQPKTNHVLVIDVVEIFVTLFRADAWECMVDLQDPTRMLHGHGPARLMDKTCRMRHPSFKMGLINSMESVHFGAKAKCKPLQIFKDLRHWTGPKQRREALKRFKADEYIDAGKVVKSELMRKFQS